MLKGFPVLIEVDLKDATRLGELICERFLASIERENTLLRPAATCRLVKSVSIPPNQSNYGQKLTEVIEAVSSLFSRIKGRGKGNVQERGEQDNFPKRKVCRETR